MLVSIWSPKGGSGASVLTAALAVVLRDVAPVRVVDLTADQAAIFGVGILDPPEVEVSPVETPKAFTDPEIVEREVLPGLRLLDRLPAAESGWLPAAGAALAVALRDGPPTVLDAGCPTHPSVASAAVEVSDHSVMVVRPCYLALRRAVRHPLLGGTCGVVVVDEPGRALTVPDIAQIIERPILGRLPLRSSVARAVDAGTLALRLPEGLRTVAERVIDGLGLGAGGRAA